MHQNRGQELEPRLRVPRPTRIPRRWGRYTAAVVMAATATITGLSATRAAAWADVPVNAPVVGITATPDGKGYWIACRDGGVFAFGNAAFYGSMGGHSLSAPVVGIARTPSGGGYWEVAADGGIFAFGDAGFFGSMGGRSMNAPVVGMAATATGGGYWEVGSDGGIFAFGDAAFYGSMGGQPLNAPVVGIASTPTGRGYWLTAADGGIFAFGDAQFAGSMGGQPLNSPITAIAATVSGNGYRLVGADGGVFSYGNASFYGSMGGQALAAPMVGITPFPAGGYWTVGADGGVFAFGGATYYGRVVYSGETPSPAPTTASVTSDMLSQIFHVSSATINAGLPSLNAEMQRGGITSPARVAAFLATLKAESGFRYDALEGGCTSSSAYYPYCGRGFIQLTWKSGYTSAGTYFGHDFVDHPDDARSLTYSAGIARWYWTVTHNMNSLADNLNMAAITRAVNGNAAPQTTLQARCTDFKAVLNYYYHFVPTGITCV